MNTPGLRKRLEEALSAASDAPVRVRIESAGQVESTPAREAARARAERQQAARVAIENDPNVKAMQESFGAVLHPDTVEPLGDD